MNKSNFDLPDPNYPDLDSPQPILELGGIKMIPLIFNLPLESSINPEYRSDIEGAVNKYHQTLLRYRISLVNRAFFPDELVSQREFNAYSGSMSNGLFLQYHRTLVEFDLVRNTLDPKYPDIVNSDVSLYIFAGGINFLRGDANDLYWKSIAKSLLENSIEDSDLGNLLRLQIRLCIRELFQDPSIGITKIFNQIPINIDSNEELTYLKTKRYCEQLVGTYLDLFNFKSQKYAIDKKRGYYVHIINL